MLFYCAQTKHSVDSNIKNSPTKLSCLAT